MVSLNRTAKVVKGGRRFSFAVLSVVGDRNGNIGFGFGKANDVSEAIRKSLDRAKRNMMAFPIKNGTLPYDITINYKSTKLILKPACPGSGIIAGGAVRSIMESGGATDVLAKCIGSRNSNNVVRAVFKCLGMLKNANTIAYNRGKAMKEFWG